MNIGDAYPSKTAAIPVIHTIQTKTSIYLENNIIGEYGILFINKFRLSFNENRVAVALVRIKAGISNKFCGSTEVKDNKNPLHPI